MKITRKKSVPKKKAAVKPAAASILVASEKAYTKNEVVQELVRSPHGDLTQYIPVGVKAAVEDPEFFSHLIAWNAIKGEIRDAKVALPVIQLASGKADPSGEFTGNSLAHMAALDPRNFLRAIRFSKSIKTGHSRHIRLLMERYLRAKEKNWSKWDRLAIQHRSSLKELYALGHIKPADRADQILFKGQYPSGSTFAVIKDLKQLPASEAAGEILSRRIPFLVAAGAMGERMKEPDVLMAIIERMSPTELVTNMKRLEKLGVKNIPACRAALEEALKKAQTSKKTTLKATTAADAVEDEKLRDKLRALQEKQFEQKVSQQGVEGDWLVAGDCSGSMSSAIEAARQIAAVLAKMVKGKVHLIFFNESPRYIDASGKSYEELVAITKHVTASGGTSIGCSLQYIIDRGLQVSGIALVSDGGENRYPVFADRYAAYKQKFGNEPTVYFYKVAGDSDIFTQNMKYAKIGFETFDLREKQLDYYSLPNLIQTMRTNRYSLIDEIMETRLLTVDSVLGLEVE